MTARIYTLILILMISLGAQPRKKYEPPDGRILHGLGQFVNLTFYTEEENWQLVTDYQSAIDPIPVIYSTYVYTDPFVDALDSTNLVDIATNHGYPYVLLVGISLFDITSSTTDVNIPVQDFLDGNLDDQIIKIAQEIKSVYPTPVFVRPGFEFATGLHNDPDNPDWTAANFIQIWIRIYDLFNQEAVTNVAWVWNAVNPQSFNYMDWYPGDEYVDWWGINYFTLSQINSGDAFLANASSRNKPVMICESNPAENGGTTNSGNWTNWFEDYFDKIKNTANIKAFVYISDPWDRTGFFDGWPDSRIDTDETIRTNYADELENSVYIHMDEYQTNPGIIDSPLPISLASFNVTSLPDANLIEWHTESEINNSGFNIYRASNEENLSINELDFLRINSSLIQGAGSSSDPNKYQFLDSQVQDDLYYWYQLEDVDYNGAKTRYDEKSIYRKKKIPNKFEIYQNYPNPFNSQTTISFNLPQKSMVYLSVFTASGEYVTTLVNRIKSEGYHQVNFNASNIASGVYIYRIQAAESIQIRKMILLK